MNNLNRKSLGHETWPTNRSSHENIFRKKLTLFRRLVVKSRRFLIFQVTANTRKQFMMSFWFFRETIKHLFKINRPHYIAILSKPYSNINNRAKNSWEIFVLKRYDTTAVCIVLRTFAHLFIIEISIQNHIKRKQPYRTSFQYSCSVTMINIVKKYLWRKIYELNTLIGCSDDS